MKKLFDLQMFADDAAADPNAPGTAEKADKVEAAADTDKKEPAKPEKKYTDEDVDRIVKNRLAREREQAKKEKEEAEKLAEMNAQQKAEYKAEQLEKELAEYKRKDALAEMSKVARKMLTEENINISDELLGMMVTTDAQQTKQNIESYAKLYKADVEAAVKARLKGETPRASSGVSTPVSEIEKRIKKYQ